jgi:hypothetical protein
MVTDSTMGAVVLAGASTLCGGGPTGSLGPYGVGLSWGRTIVHDERTVTITGTMASGVVNDVYNLDGSPSRNVIRVAAGDVDQDSRVAWDGAALVITTASTFNGQALERVMRLSLNAGELVVQTSGTGGRGGVAPGPSTRRYKKCTPAMAADAARILANPERGVAIVRAPASPPSNAPSEPAVTWLGDRADATQGTTATMTVNQSVPAGSLVVVLVAGRGSEASSVSDFKGNVWRTAVRESNASGACAVGVFHSTLTTALVAGDPIIATWRGASNRPKAVGALKATNVRSLDQVGSARTNADTLLAASTAAPVTAASGLLVAATCTGQSTETSFDNANGFVRQFQFSARQSSGSFSYRIDTALSGVQSFRVAARAAPGGAANFATVIATFK